MPELNVFKVPAPAPTDTTTSNEPTRDMFETGVLAATAVEDNLFVDNTSVLPIRPHGEEKTRADKTVTEDPPVFAAFVGFNTAAAAAA